MIVFPVCEMAFGSGFEIAFGSGSVLVLTLALALALVLAAPPLARPVLPSCILASRFLYCLLSICKLNTAFRGLLVVVVGGSGGSGGCGKVTVAISHLVVIY